MLTDTHASIEERKESGHLASKHYADFIKPWLHVQHHPMLFERTMIEANAEGTLQMVAE